MSEIVNSNIQIEQTTDEPLTKPKRPRTTKQLEAFKKVQEKRQQLIKEKNDQKLIEGAKLMLQQQEKTKQSQPQQPPQTPQTKPKYQPIPQTEEEEEEEESDEEVIIVKKAKSKQKPKPKKKVTRVIIESDSEEEESEEEYEEPKRQVTIMRQKINTDDFFC